MAATSTDSFAPALVHRLESGDRLGAIEFLRRYEAMPDVKKAELIEELSICPLRSVWCMPLQTQ